MRAYCQLISGIDAAVGMVLEALERQGVADNTVVIYTSDNGYFCGAHGLQGKVLPYDDAALIPLIIRDPRAPATQTTRATEGSSAATYPGATSTTEASITRAEDTADGRPSRRHTRT